MLLDFLIFFSNLFSRSFFQFEAIYWSLVLWGKLLSILKYYVKYVNFMVQIFPNFVNFDRFDENQYLRNFPFRVYLRNLIPAKRFFRIHLRKLIIDQLFKFIFTGIYCWVFSSNKKHSVYPQKKNTSKILEIPLGRFCFCFQNIP